MASCAHEGLLVNNGSLLPVTGQLAHRFVAACNAQAISKAQSPTKQQAETQAAYQNLYTHSRLEALSDGLSVSFMVAILMEHRDGIDCVVN